MLRALLILTCGIKYVSGLRMLPRVCTWLVKVLLLQNFVGICEECILRRFIDMRNAIHMCAQQLLCDHAHEHKLDNSYR